MNIGIIGTGTIGRFHAQAVRAMDGGGALMNQAIHRIDALLHLAGPVRAAMANTACLAHERIKMEDLAVAILEFENRARSVIAGLTCSWSHNSHPAWVQLGGTEGSVFLAKRTTREAGRPFCEWMIYIQQARLEFFDCGLLELQRAEVAVVVGIELVEFPRLFAGLCFGRHQVTKLDQ